MKIKDFASQFTVFIFCQDLDLGSSIKVQVSQAGYESFYIGESVQFLERVKESVPHVVVFFVSSLKEDLSHFVQKILEVSPEIKMIPVAEEPDFAVLKQYEEYGFVGILNLKSNYLEERIVWAINRACENLYFNYQNEQLFSELQQAQLKYKNQEQELEVLKNQILALKSEKGTFRSLEPLVKSYKIAENKEQVIQLFLEQMNGGRVLYFKYLPSVRSLMVTQSAGFPIEDLKGVGCQLSTAEVADLSSQMALGIPPGSLSVLLREALSIQSATWLPLFVGSLFEGLFVIPDSVDSERKQVLLDQFSLFSLAFEKLSLAQRIQEVDFHDPVSETYNDRYYSKKLNEEVLRARRMKHPLAVVKVAIDDFLEIEQSLGDQVRDLVVKTIATLMVKSSRAHDFVARVKTNELALVLVNCSKLGASHRAERLRRTVETSSILDHGVKISISVGVSEYPSLSDSASQLDLTASQALEHIKSKGGNRICLFKAATNFKPEFLVSEGSGEV